MFNLKRIETISLSSKIENAYSIDVSQTGYISITTSAFLLIYQIIPNKENCTLKDDLDLNIKEFLFDLPQERYYESILRVDLTPDLDIVQQYIPKFVKCLWSPPRCDKNYDCVLATLTSNGVVEIYVKEYDKNYNSEFIRICNVTQKYTKILKETWGDFSNESCTDKLKELICRANEAKAKCFTWSSDISLGYYVLILGHLSSKITFWKVNLEMESKELSVDFWCAYQSDLDSVTCLTWKQTSDGALLFIGNKTGCVCTLSVKRTSEKLNVEKTRFLQIEKDDLRVHSIHLMNTTYGCFIIIVKVTTIIFIPIEKSCNTYEFACNNIEILDIIIVENHMLILTRTGVIKEVVLSITPSGVDIKWRHFYIDINTYMKCPVNIFLSKNKMLFFVLTKYCKPKQSARPTSFVDLHIFGNNETGCLQNLLDNPSKQLTYMWDCLELYRCNAFQTKNLLLDNIQFENHYDKYDFYTLKVFSFVSRICESISDQLKQVPAIRPYDEVHSVLHLKMVVVRMQHLLELYRKNGGLTNFHYQNLLILSNYIRQISVEDMAKVLDLSDSMIDTIVEIMQRVKNIKFEDIQMDRCVICEDKMYDIACMPPHFDMRCAISLMQIKGIVRYKCLGCNSIACEEIAKEVRIVVCPFCDTPMLERPEGGVEKYVKNE